MLGSASSDGVLVFLFKIFFFSKDILLLSVSENLTISRFVINLLRSCRSIHCHVGYVLQDNNRTLQIIF